MPPKKTLKKAKRKDEAVKEQVLEQDESEGDTSVELRNDKEKGHDERIGMQIKTNVEYIVISVLHGKYLNYFMIIEVKNGNGEENKKESSIIVMKRNNESELMTGPTPKKLNMKLGPMGRSPIKIQQVACYTVRARGNFVFLYAMGSGVTGKAGYTKPIEDKLKADSSFKEICGIYDVLYRRGANGDNMPSEVGSAYGWKMFMHVMNGDTDISVNEAGRWARQVMILFNKETPSYKYPCEYDYRGDRTLLNDDGSLPPAATYLKDQDLLEILDDLYPRSEAEPEERIAYLAPLYFGNVADGVSLMTNHL